jgi:hypothetical protein
MERTGPTPTCSQNKLKQNVMIITKKQKPIGILAGIAAFLIFGGYWWFLLEPMQTQLIESGKEPTFIGTAGASLLVGSVIAFLTQISLIFLGLSKRGLDFTLSKLFKSIDFWKWMVWVNVIVGAFSLMWKYGNF